MWSPPPPAIWPRSEHGRRLLGKAPAGFPPGDRHRRPGPLRQRRVGRDFQPMNVNFGIIPPGLPRQGQAQQKRRHLPASAGDHDDAVEQNNRSSSMKIIVTPWAATTPPASCRGRALAVKGWAVDIVLVGRVEEILKLPEGKLGTTTLPKGVELMATPRRWWRWRTIPPVAFRQAGLLHGPGPEAAPDGGATPWSPPAAPGPFSPGPPWWSSASGASAGRLWPPWCPTPRGRWCSSTAAPTPSAPRNICCSSPAWARTTPSGSWAVEAPGGPSEHRRGGHQGRRSLASGGLRAAAKAGGGPI